MIYLDNAATTFPKPECVINEVSKCMRDYCGNPGRGSHSLSMMASEMVFRAREHLNGMFNGYSPERCIFTLNTTYALNIALKSAVSDGCHILISDLEHNSVLRQVEKLKTDGRATYDIFRTFGGDCNKITNELKSKIKKNTGILICQIASNICGITMPVEQIGKLCRINGIIFIADAAQFAGKYAIDIKKMNIDALCLPAHKGLYGPQGTGAVLFSERYFEHADTLIEGGSGSNSLSTEMPEVLPDRFEAGTVPTPAVSGLLRGVEFVSNTGIASICEHESELTEYLLAALCSDSRFEVYSPLNYGGIVLFNVKGKTSTETADELNERGICVRAGFHCAPLAHKTLSTGNSGAVRVSFGVFNTRDDVRKLKDALYYLK